MENLTNIFLFLSNENEGIQLNTDIFEANIINLALLIVLVINVAKDVLGSILSARKASILYDLPSSINRSSLKSS